MNHKRKQAERFEQLICPHLNTMYKAARRLVATNDEAEDLVQQVLVKLYPKTDQMESVERLGPWLKKVLYRQFIDDFRKKSRKAGNFTTSDENPVEELPGADQNPEILVVRAGDWRMVRQALDTLDADNRALIVMHYVEGYTLAELSEMLNVPAETLKTRLRRAKARLKKILRT